MRIRQSCNGLGTVESSCAGIRGWWTECVIIIMVIIMRERRRTMKANKPRKLKLKNEKRRCQQHGATDRCCFQEGKEERNSKCTMTIWR